MSVPHIDYAEAWREMLKAWALPPKIVERAPEAEKPDGDGWRSLAEQFQRMADQARESPPGPLISRVLDWVTPEATVLDVGAGTGRQTLQLAPHVGHLIAVEPSPAMREFLTGEIHKHGFNNVELLADRWQDAEVPVADIAVCANVLYDVQDLVPFVSKLNDHARDACFIELTFRHPVARMNDMWRRFWDLERPERPDYFDAVAVLHQMGIYANVAIERVPANFWYPSLDDAVEDYRRRLRLAPDAKRDAELRAYIQAYIQEHSREMDNRIYPGPASRRIVVLWWAKGSVGDSQ